MLKKLCVIGIFLGCTAALPAPQTRGQWQASMGMGLTFSPEMFLLMPQIEYVHSRNVSYGGLIQLGLRGGVTLFTGSASIRYSFDVSHRSINPFVEGGAGIAAASGFVDSFGVHLHIAGGIDYHVSHSFSVGSLIRLNFAPPIDTFFLSWPIVVGRIRF